MTYITQHVHSEQTFISTLHFSLFCVKLMHIIPVI